MPFILRSIRFNYCRNLFESPDVCVNQPSLLGETSCIIEGRDKPSVGTNREGKGKKNTLRLTGRQNQERESEKKMNLRMSSYFTALSHIFHPGADFVVACAVAAAALAAAVVVVVVLVWVCMGKCVPTLIRWLIRLPVRQASTALRGCLSEVRVRASAAAQLFIVLT